jgi:hypothetical protein
VHCISISIQNRDEEGRKKKSWVFYIFYFSLSGMFFCTYIEHSSCLSSARCVGAYYTYEHGRTDERTRGASVSPSVSSAPHSLFVCPVPPGDVPPVPADASSRQWQRQLTGSGACPGWRRRRLGHDFSLEAWAAAIARRVTRAAESVPTTLCPAHVRAFRRERVACGPTHSSADGQACALRCGAGATRLLPCHARAQLDVRTAKLARRRRLDACVRGDGSSGRRACAAPAPPRGARQMRPPPGRRLQLPVPADAGGSVLPPPLRQQGEYLGLWRGCGCKRGCALAMGPRYE